MQQILNFLIKSRNTLWFLFLLVLAVLFTIQSHSYHSNKLINSSNFLTGKVFEAQNNIKNYFNLNAYNKRLLEENTKLKQQLNQLVVEYPKNNHSLTDDSLGSQKPKFTYIPATVINSTFTKKKNYLTLNKGSKDSVVIDMGVITDLGIVGVVEKVSNGYASVISILNENSSINAQLKKTNHFGSLIWNGKAPNIVQLTDIPRQANLKLGDTIITGGRSTIFPKGIPIGSILDFTLNKEQNYYTVNVALFNDMTDVGFVQLIKNNDNLEIKEIESYYNEQ